MTAQATQTRATPAPDFATHDTLTVPDGFRRWDARSGFGLLLGPVYLHESRPIAAMRVDARHLNVQDIAHGGFLAALADSAYGYIFRRDLPDILPRTVHLSVDYLAAVQPGDWLEAHVDFVRRGKRLTNGTCRLMVGDRVVLQTTAVFSTVRREAVRPVVSLAS